MLAFQQRGVWALRMRRPHHLAVVNRTILWYIAIENLLSSVAVSTGGILDCLLQCRVGSVLSCPSWMGR
jgi:hypothetical protein